MNRFWVGRIGMLVVKAKDPLPLNSTLRRPRITVGGLFRGDPERHSTPGFRVAKPGKGDRTLENSQSANAWVSVYEFLKDKIIRGIYGPGEKLNERDIAQLANVSRTPTREALRVLEYEGFVTNVSKRGVIVKKYSPEELDTLHKMLVRLEGLAVEMAAPKLTEKDLALLEKMTNRLEGLAHKGS